MISVLYAVLCGCEQFEQGRVLLNQRACDIETQLDGARAAAYDLSVWSVFSLERIDVEASRAMFQVASVGASGGLSNALVQINATIDLKDVGQTEVFVSVFDSVLGRLSNVTVVGQITILNKREGQALHLSRFLGSYYKPVEISGCASSLAYTVRDALGKDVTVAVSNTFEFLAGYKSLYESSIKLYTTTKSDLERSGVISCVESMTSGQVCFSAKLDAQEMANVRHNYYVAADMERLEIGEKIPDLLPFVVDAASGDVSFQISFNSTGNDVAYMAPIYALVKLQGRYYKCQEHQIFDTVARQCVVFSECKKQRRVRFQQLCVPQCIYGYLEIEGTCYQGCPFPLGYAPNQTNSSNCIKCPGKASEHGCVDYCAAREFIQQLGCVKSCAAGQVIQRLEMICLEPANERTCTESAYQYLVEARLYGDHSAMSYCSQRMPSYVYINGRSNTLNLRCHNGIVLANRSCGQVESGGNFCTPPQIFDITQDSVSQTSFCRYMCINGSLEYNGTCVNSCPLGYYANAEQARCQMCNQKAYDGGSYFDKATGKCVDECKFYISDASGAKICVSSAECSFYIQVGESRNCMDGCGQLYGIESSQECVTKCGGDYPYLSKTNICMKSCPRGWSEIAGVKQCIDRCEYPLGLDAQQHCTTCTAFVDRASGACKQTCQYVNGSRCEQINTVYCQYYTQQDGQTTCSNVCSQYVQATDNKCTDACSADLFYAPGNRCVAKCETGFWKTVGEKKVCQNACNFTADGSECLDACPLGQTLLDRATNRCVSECTYYNSTFQKCEQLGSVHCPYWYYSGSVKECRLTSAGMLLAEDGVLCTLLCERFVAQDYSGCVPVCPSGFFYAWKNNRVCTAQQLCLEEMGETYLNQKQCRVACSGFLADECIEECAGENYVQVAPTGEKLCQKNAPSFRLYSEVFKQWQALDACPQRTFLTSQASCSPIPCSKSDLEHPYHQAQTCAASCTVLTEELECITQCQGDNVSWGESQKFCGALCPGALLKDTSAKSCVVACAAGQYLEGDACVQECESGKVSASGICQQKCVGYGLIRGGYVECTNTEQCPVEFGFLMNNRSCVNRCGAYIKANAAVGAKYVCVDRCTSYFTVDVTGAQECYDVCPEDRPRISSSRECVSECLSQEFYDARTGTCVEQCSVYAAINRAAKTCDYECMYETIRNVSRCVDTCPQFVARRPHLSLSKLRYECISGCAETKQQFVQMGTQMVCMSCSAFRIQKTIEPYQYPFYSCVDSCPTDTVQLGDMCYYNVCANLSAKFKYNNEGKCVSSCLSKFVRYNNETNDYLCVSQCYDYSDSVFIREGSEKMCVESCTPPLINYDYDDRSVECVLKCPLGLVVDVVYNPVCTRKCMNTYEDEIDGVTYTLTLYTLQFGYLTCEVSDNCKFYEKMWVDDEAQLIDYFCYSDSCSSSSLHKIAFPVNDTHNQCVSKCPDGYYRYEETVNYSTVSRCVAQCPTTYFCDLTKACLATCDKNASFVNETHARCIGECSKFRQSPFFVRETGSCVAACPAGYYVSEQNECLSECALGYYKLHSSGYKICISKCEDASLPESFYIVPVAQTDGMIMCDNFCTGPDELYDPGTEQCQKACSQGYFSLGARCMKVCPLVSDTGSGKCVDTCSSGFYRREGQVRYCIECDLTREYQRFDTTLNLWECVQACDETEFYDDRDCLASCRSNIVSGKTCVADCASRFETISGIRYCLTSCLYTSEMNSIRVSNYSKQCTSQCGSDSVVDYDMGEQICVERCRSPKRYNAAEKKCDEFCAYVNENQAQYCVQATSGNVCGQMYQLVHGSNDIECVSFCEEFLEGNQCVSSCESGFYIMVNGSTRQCINACPTQFRYDFMHSQTMRRCVGICSNVPNTPYSLVRRCVAECPDNKYYAATLSCALTENAGVHYALQDTLLGKETQVVYPGCLERDRNLSGVCSPRCSQDLPWFDATTGLCQKACPLALYAEKRQECQQPQACLFFYTERKDKRWCVETCLETENSFYVGTECVSVCPEGFYEDGFACKTRCSDKEFLEAGACKDKCQTNIYHRETRQCVQTLSECLFFYRNQDAFVCVDFCDASDSIMHSGECTGKCPVGQFRQFDGFCGLICATNIYDKTEQKCVKTSQECAFILHHTDGTDNCLQECMSPYKQDGAQCRDRCGDKYEEDGFCVSACISNSYQVVDGENRCVNDCPNLRRKMDLSGMYQCLDVCLDFKQGRDCVTQCDPGYMADGDVCISQKDDCISGRLKNGRTCTMYCPAAVFDVAEAACLPSNDACILIQNEDQTAQQACVPICSDPLFAYGRYCLEKCPTDFSLSLYGYCHDTCMGNMFVDGSYCVAKCPKSRKFHNSNKVCVEKCELFDGKTLRCLPADTKCITIDRRLQQQFGINCTETCDFSQSLAESQWECVDSCQFYSIQDGLKRCQPSCDGRLFYLDGKQRQVCVLQCPQSFPVKLDSQCLQSCPQGFKQRFQTCEHKNKGLQNWAIITIVVGTVFLVGGGFATAFFLHKRKGRKINKLQANVNNINSQVFKYNKKQKEDDGLETISKGGRRQYKLARGSNNEALTESAGPDKPVLEVRQLVTSNRTQFPTRGRMAEAALGGSDEKPSTYV